MKMAVTIICVLVAVVLFAGYVLNRYEQFIRLQQDIFNDVIHTYGKEEYLENYIKEYTLDSDIIWHFDKAINRQNVLTEIQRFEIVCYKHTESIRDKYEKLVIKIK